MSPPIDYCARRTCEKTITELKTDKSGHPIPLLWCSQCRVAVCEECWYLYEPHVPSRRNKETFRPHEPSTLSARDLINEIHLTITEKQHTELDSRDVETKWFGVVDSVFSQEETKLAPHLWIFERFRLLFSSSNADMTQIFPSLVAFIGDTGEGKSTMIRALIKTGSTVRSPAKYELPMGGPDDGNPMTGDIHLFADPQTLESNRQILYCDSEGFKGGNNPSKKSLTRAMQKYSQSKWNRHQIGQEVLKKKIGNPAKLVKLSKSDATPSQLVKTLYPAILFTFSDVICFVTRSSQKMEEDAERLIRWAEMAFDSSINQPILPHLVMIYNARKPKDGGKHKDDFWDSDFATAYLLSRLDGLVNADRDYDPIEPERRGLIQRRAKEWRDRGAHITTFRDLLRCYFSEVKIVCVPHRDADLKLLQNQYKLLYDEIKRGSQVAKERRRASGTLMSGEDMDEYTNMAFHHFATQPLGKPFNFMTAALCKRPVNDRVQGHLQDLLINWTTALYGVPESKSIPWLLPYIASCIFLDIQRSRYPGHVDTIIPPYIQMCESALEEFYREHWRCSETSPKNGERCVNTSAGHGKGHQGRNGKTFKSGPFSQSDTEFNDLMKEMKVTISYEVRELFTEITMPESNGNNQESQESFLQQHYGKARKLFTDLYCSTTCLCCLSYTPKNTLKCGHQLCDLCVSESGYLSECRNYWWFTTCPLCVNHWHPPYPVTHHSSHAGVRVLSLDGGGMRSIMQLTLLDQLEQVIGLNVPISHFFDLIVGTSAGAIVGFGLGLKMTDAKECATLFKELIPEAFKAKMLTSLPRFGNLIAALWAGKYKTKPLKEALIKAFGEGNLFGCPAPSHPPNAGTPLGPPCAKVAATAVSSNNKIYILTNYHRQDGPYTTGCSKSYSIFREKNHDKEIQTWEALRSTSAAPGYFKPFHHKATGHSFDDGAVRVNNPAQIASNEARLLWPHASECAPDILLSIGTGYDAHCNESERNIPGPQDPHLFSRGVRIARGNMQEVLRGDDAWGPFRNQPRHYRLNIDLKAKPALDDVKKLPDLELLTKRLCGDPNIIPLKEIAASMISSLFYVEERRGHHNEINPQCINYKGKIFCRLGAYTRGLKSLCGRLIHHMGTRYEPLPVFHIKTLEDYVPIQMGMVQFREMCHKISEGPAQTEPAFVVPISFYAQDHRPTEICMRVEPRYTSSSKDTFHPLSAFPRFLESQPSGSGQTGNRLSVKGTGLIKRPRTFNPAVNRLSTTGSGSHLGPLSRTSSDNDLYTAAQLSTPSPWLVDLAFTMDEDDREASLHMREV